METGRNGKGIFLFRANAKFSFAQGLQINLTRLEFQDNTV